MKKYLALIIALVTLLSFSTVSFAENSASDDFILKANEAATKIEVKLQEKEDKNYEKVDASAAKTNAKIIKMIEKAMESKNLDIERLVLKTNEMAFKVIEKAAKDGIEVLCEYEAYEIQGQIVYIDPLKVVRR